VSIGINPYALGFAMMQDIRQICETPTAEDREWFPDIAGSRDWRGVLKHAWANYRDESFIQQYLSPRLIRKFRLFSLEDDAQKPFYTVSDIHNEQGYRRIRESLARAHDPAALDPDIQITDVDLLGDRHLHLKHAMRNGIPLDAADRDRVFAYLKRLWGYDVILETGA
jgi:stage V sporulation protein R